MSRLPAGAGGGYFGGDTIVYQGKPSTRTRLHELAHKRLSHVPGKYEVSKLIDTELEAEIWAWRAMDKQPTYRVGSSIFNTLVSDYDFTPAKAYALVSKALRGKGIPSSKAQAYYYLTYLTKVGS